MEKISKMWKELQKDGRFSKGILSSACESEVKLLLQQVDSMMEVRVQEYESRLKELQNKIKHKDIENTKQRVALEQRSKEIGSLKQQLLDSEKNQRICISQHETQLMNLRTEVAKVKKDYERLNRKYKHQAKESEKEREKGQAFMRSNVDEVNQLTSKLEEYKQRGKDWELQRRTYQKQIEALDHQRKALTEKCELMQSQSQSYQTQLDRRRELLDNTEQTYKNKITQLEGQIARSNETLVLQEKKVEKFKSSLEETMAAHKKAMDDNEKLIEELKKASGTIKGLEKTKASLEAEVQSKEDMYRAASEDTTQYREDMLKMENTLAEKDKIIRSLGDLKYTEENEKITELKESLDQAQEDIRKGKRTEKSLREEVAKLQSHLSHSLDNCEKLTDELDSRKSDFSDFESEKIITLQNELVQLRDELAAEKESHQAEKEGMNMQISKLTSELHSKNVTMATLSHQAENLDKHLRDETEVFQKKMAELQVANAQIEALRLENRHLRQSILHQTNVNADSTLTSDQIRVIRNTYSANCEKLEKENQQLKEDLDSVKEEMNEMEERFEEQLRMAMSESEACVSEKRQMEKMEEDFHRRLQDLEKRLKSSQNEYEAQIQHLTDSKEALEERLQSALMVHNKQKESLANSRSSYSDWRKNEHSLRYSDPDPEDRLFFTRAQSSHTARVHSGSNHNFVSKSLDSDKHCVFSRNGDMHLSDGYYSLDSGKDTSGANAHDNLNYSKSSSDRNSSDSHVSVSNGLAAFSEKNSYPAHHPHSYHSNQHLSDVQSKYPDISHKTDTSITKCSNHNESFETIRSSRPMSISESLPNLHDVSIEVPNSRVSVSEKFLEEENKRAKQLEMLIDSHIEDLRIGTEKIIKKNSKR